MATLGMVLVCGSGIGLAGWLGLILPLSLYRVGRENRLLASRA